MKRIQINKDLIPYYFDILLNQELFRMEIKYNKSADLFTVGLSKNGTLLCEGEPMIYGIPLFGSIKNEHFPSVTITPIDHSGIVDAVTFDNLGRTVFLMVEESAADG